MTLSWLKFSTMDPWQKLKFPKHHKIGISNFLVVFSQSKCHLSARLGIVISKFVHFEISLVVKVTLSYWMCSTMDPWLKLKFPKHHEIGISTFLIVFSALKCHLSHRLGIVRSKLVYFEISLIVRKCSSLD